MIGKSTITTTSNKMQATTSAWRVTTEQPSEAFSLDQPLKIQLASDLHLELPTAARRLPDVLRDTYGVEEGCIPVLAHCLALLGDIGYPSKQEYEAFILQEAKRFEHVFVLAGNHEFYSASGVRTHYTEVLEQIRTICAKASNVTFLDRTSVLFRGYRILGATLWSETSEQESSMNDYKAIFVEEDGVKRKITPKDTYDWHKKDLEWLQEEIAKAEEAGEDVIIMTHHAPTFKRTSSPSFLTKNPHIATDLEYLMKAPVRAWLFGHTHWSSMQVINNVLVASNQMGYFVKGEHTLGHGTGFKPRFVVHSS